MSVSPPRALGLHARRSPPRPGRPRRTPAGGRAAPRRRRGTARTTRPRARRRAGRASSSPRSRPAVRRRRATRSSRISVHDGMPEISRRSWRSTSAAIAVDARLPVRRCGDGRARRIAAADHPAAAMHHDAREIADAARPPPCGCSVRAAAQHEHAVRRAARRPPTRSAAIRSASQPPRRCARSASGVTGIDLVARGRAGGLHPVAGRPGPRHVGRAAPARRPSDGLNPR